MAFPSCVVKQDIGFPIPYCVNGWQSPTMPQDKITEFSGERLKTLRKRHRMTQQQVADSIGYARPTIGVWEQGHDFPGRDAILLLCEFFRVPISHFLPGVEKTTGPKGGNVVDDPDELALLGFWRGLSRDQRLFMLRMVGGAHLGGGGIGQPNRRKSANAKGDDSAPSD